MRQNALSLVVAQGDHVQRVDRDDVVAVQHQVVDRLYRDLLWRVQVGWEDPLSVGARLDGMPRGKRHALYLDDIGKLAFGDRRLDKSLHSGDRSVSTCDLVPVLKVLYGFSLATSHLNKPFSVEAGSVDETAVVGPAGPITHGKC